MRRRRPGQRQQQPDERSTPHRDPPLAAAPPRSAAAAPGIAPRAARPPSPAASPPRPRAAPPRMPASPPAPPRSTRTRWFPKADATGPCQAPGGSAATAAKNPSPNVPSTELATAASIVGGSSEPRPTLAGSAPPASAASAAPGSASPRNTCRNVTRAGRREPLRMRLKIRLQLRLARRQRPRAGIAQELHLLPQPPPDHRVVPVEPQRQRLAIVDLLPNVVVDQPRPLRRRRRPPPHRLELADDPLDHRRRHLDDGLIRPRRRRANRAMDGKDRNPDQQEVE